MRIVARKGSELESVIKGMWEQLIGDEAAAKEFIRERVGVEPASVCYIWVFGDTGRFVSQDISFKEEDWDKVDKRILVQRKGETCFNVNRRTKDGRRFEKDFNTRFGHFIRHEPLEKFGIYMFAENRYWSWQPLYEKEAGLYLIHCSDAAFHYQKVTADSQFEMIP